MQEVITLICIDQDLRCHIVWLGHNELNPTADELHNRVGWFDRPSW